MAILIAAGVETIYQKSPNHVINTDKFEKVINLKENTADHKIQEIKSILLHNTFDSLKQLTFKEKDLSFYVFSDNLPVFWSDNHIDYTYDIQQLPAENWQYKELNNAYCLIKNSEYEDYKIVAIIFIKNKYPYENEELQNTYNIDLKTDKTVDISIGKPADHFAITDQNQHYLFTLVPPLNPVYNKTAGYIGFAAEFAAFILLLLIYINFGKTDRQKQISPKQFILNSLILVTITALGLFCNFPRLLFWDHLFSSYEYSSNDLLASMGHLTLFSLLVLAINYSFFFRVKIKSTPFVQIFLQVLFTLFYILLFYILKGIVIHSAFQLNILQFSDFSFMAIWAHLLVFLWGVSLTLLFYKTHGNLKGTPKLPEAVIIDIVLLLLTVLYFHLFQPRDIYKTGFSLALLYIAFYIPLFIRKRKKASVYSFIWVLIYTLFFVVSSILISNQKMRSKYRILAENIYINGNTEYDRVADILLEELDKQIESDNYLRQILTREDSLSVASAYINENFSRGFWNKYSIRLYTSPVGSEMYNQYFDFINRAGTKIKHTHFYSVPAIYNDMSYLGIFPYRVADTDSYLFMEFYPRKNYRSYSFPNLLISSSPDIQNQLKITVGKYDNGKLVFSSSKSDYPENDEWITKKDKPFYSATYHGRKYYFYRPDKNDTIVISAINQYGQDIYLIYFAYVFLCFYSLSWLIFTIYYNKRSKSGFSLGFTAKYQYAFIALLIISFLGIFYVSVDFIRKKYSEEQISNLEHKKTYIQNALQDMYYWNQDLSLINQQGLNFDLQELSYTYQTDILVYDNQGELVGSSQPLIFSKNLISKLITPQPFFKNNTNINQQEHIGELKYLTGYADFYNGDFVQIGYIAVPQFLSQEEINNEIESFLAVIIHIYLIIIILAIVLSLLIGKQLSAPLKMIEDKLKLMRFGHRNEKIEYQYNDEIGHLVMQYNRTLDELEKSARLLAQSERESAWKTMARQIAHEINNPLTPMKLTIQQLQRTHQMKDERFDDYFKKSAVTLIEQIDNLSRIAGTFSNFARMPEARFVTVDIAARLYSVVQLFAHNNESTTITFNGPQHDIFTFADPEQLTQVYNNLLKNAIQSVPSDRHVKINVTISVAGENIITEISDNGSGITDEVAEKLFAPNFTTKNTGMGLGLTITKNIIETTGGTISFTSRVGEGTTFKVTLPVEK